MNTKGLKSGEYYFSWGDNDTIYKYIGKTRSGSLHFQYTCYYLLKEYRESEFIRNYFLRKDSGFQFRVIEAPKIAIIMTLGECYDNVAW